MAVGPPYGVADNVDDAARLVHEHTDGSGVALAFGHSFGGNVALALAERYPPLVRRVCIYESPLSWLDWWPKNTAGGMALEQQDAASAAEVVMRGVVGDDTGERMPPAIRSSRCSEGHALVGELADLCEHPPWIGLRIRQPVLAMFGERSCAHHRRAMSAAPGLIPRAQVGVVPGAGHLGPSTHADAVCSAIHRFIRATTVLCC
jgi:pimeloyl-ACP methyl ester carboxylesterase